MYANNNINLEYLGFHTYENFLYELEIINLQCLKKELCGRIINEYVDYIPYKIIVKLNQIDCKEYDYDINIIYDVAENYLNYYSIKIQFIKK